MKEYPMTQGVVSLTYRHWTDTTQKVVDKKGNNNPSKDGSLKRIISAFLFLMEHKIT